MLRLYNTLSPTFKKFVNKSESTRVFFETIGNYFPPLGTSFIEFDVDDHTYFDFQFLFRRTDYDTTLFSPVGDLSYLPENIIGSTEWQGIMRFSNFINQRENAPWFEAVGLEFDEIVYQNFPIPIPGIFFNVPQSSSVNIDLLCGALEALFQTPLSDSNKKNLGDALFHLPENNLAAAGVFLGRKSQKIRISLRMPMGDLDYYLNKIGVECPSEIRDVLNRSGSLLDDNFRINVDVDDSGITFQSIEVKCPSCVGERFAATSDERDNWRSLIEYLQNQGWCGSDSLKLAEWIFSSDGLEFDQNVTRITNRSTFPKYYFGIISHLKLVLVNGRKTTKAYLAEGCFWPNNINVSKSEENSSTRLTE